MSVDPSNARVSGSTPAASESGLHDGGSCLNVAGDPLLGLASSLGIAPKLRHPFHVPGIVPFRMSRTRRNAPSGRNDTPAPRSALIPLRDSRPDLTQPPMRVTVGLVQICAGFSR